MGYVRSRSGENVRAACTSNQTPTVVGFGIPDLVRGIWEKRKINSLNLYNTIQNRWSVSVKTARKTGGTAPVRDGPCARPRAGEQASARSTLTMIVDSVDVGLKVALESAMESA